LTRLNQINPVPVRVLGKGGPKFKASERAVTNLQVGPNSISMQAGTIVRLTGVYDLYVQWDDAPVREGGLPGTVDSQPRVASTPSDSERGSIFTAVPDQLGLRLEAQRAAVNVLVMPLQALLQVESHKKRLHRLPESARCIYRLRLHLVVFLCLVGC